jgi:predicted N-acyltransferase
MPEAFTPKVRVVDSIARIDKHSWNALFPGEPEDHDYLAAVEAAGLEGFHWRYIVAEQGDRLLAAAPAFITQYALETTLDDGAGRTVVRGLGRVLPGITTLRLACLGSPCTETAQIGWSADLSPGQRDDLTGRMMAALEQTARAERCGLMAVKDVPAMAGRSWAAALESAGYSAVAGLPTAELTIDFRSVEIYLTRLSPGTRKDMRRKLRAFDQVRVEVRHDLTGLEDQVMALYGQTRARGELQFETLTDAYFTGVLKRMGERALCVLYFVEDELLAANLLLVGDDVLLDKFFCMSAEGRRHNLYFLSWFTNIGLCLERGLGRYQSGQAAYANKLRLGSRLLPTTLYFRHRNPVANRVLRWIAPLLAPTQPSASAFEAAA